MKQYFKAIVAASIENIHTVILSVWTLVRFPKTYFGSNTDYRNWTLSGTTSKTVFKKITSYLFGDFMISNSTLAGQFFESTLHSSTVLNQIKSSNMHLNAIIFITL